MGSQNYNYFKIIYNTSDTPPAITTKTYGSINLNDIDSGINASAYGSGNYYDNGAISSVFVDYANYNYVLSNTCSINVKSGGLNGKTAGWDTLGFPTDPNGNCVDITGKPRPATGPWTIGAYEAN